MGKNDWEIVRLAGEHVLDLFSNASAEVPLIYRGYKRSRELVDDCREIAKGSKLNGDAGQIVLLSAWFYDAGFAVAKKGAREKSIEIARDFLSRQGQPESVADAVAACIEGVAGGQDGPDGPAGAILHDALLAPLGSKSYLAQAELFRLEEEQRTGKVYSDLEWTQNRIDYLNNNNYHTRWAQLEYEGRKAKTLARLHRRLRRHLEEATEQKAEEAKITKNEGRTFAGLFGDLSRNQLRLLSIADRRSSTMIHVNAIMISLVVGMVVRTIDHHRNLLVPTIVLLCVNVAVIVLSILSMRAKRENLLEGESADDGKLLLVTNEENITLASYLQRMTALVSDGPALQAAMMEYLYYARKRLIHRRRSLKLTYDIFIYGLAVSVALFVVAILRA
jgi:hypothetical protein